MNETLEQQFASLRKALKICSFGALILTLFNVPMVMNTVRAAESTYRDMMNNQPVPKIVHFVTFIGDHFLLIAPIVLLGVIGIAVVNVRSKGGVFLYVNMGSILALMSFNGLLLFSAQMMLRAPFEALRGVQ